MDRRAFITGLGAVLAFCAPQSDCADETFVTRSARSDRDGSGRITCARARSRFRGAPRVIPQCGAMQPTLAYTLCRIAEAVASGRDEDREDVCVADTGARGGRPSRRLRYCWALER